MECANAAVMDSQEGTWPHGGAADVREAHGVIRRSSLVLGALPTAVACARLHARQVLWEWDVPADVDATELLVSELITNGLKASWATGFSPPVWLRMAASASSLLIEVWHGNEQQPAPAELDDGVPDLDGEGGRGLFLVAALSRAWGWYPTRYPLGKVTWCELQMAAVLPSR
jgi:anti-sigma regulatory factor (Ser/Thr protein kinase)